MNKQFCHFRSDLDIGPRVLILATNRVLIRNIGRLLTSERDIGPRGLIRAPTLKIGLLFLLSYLRQIMNKPF